MLREMMVKTDEQYAVKAHQLRRAAETALQQIPITNWEFVRWLIDDKRFDLLPSSWRLYRNAVATTLDYSSDGDAAALLRSVPAAHATERRTSTKKTSANKAKRLLDDDCDRLVALTLLSRSSHAQALVEYLHAARLTGLRPCEWPSVQMESTPSQTILVVKNAKESDARAHSPTRALIFTELPASHQRMLDRWLARVRDTEDYPALQQALGKLIHSMARRAFPRRKKHPTLYCARHEFTARIKRHYLDLCADKFEAMAIVAALLGHATDATASEHYARPERIGGRKFPVPGANPVEIAKIRPKLEQRFASLNAGIKRNGGCRSVAPRPVGGLPAMGFPVDPE